MNNKEFKYIVQFYIHHNSGVYPYHGERVYTGSKSDINAEVNSDIDDLQKRINKKFSYKVVKRELITEDIVDKVVKEEKEFEDIKTKSKQMSAEDAIDFIKSNDYTYLVERNFLSDDENRITVKNAMENKKNKQ